MADFLTHIFLPLTAVYVLRGDLWTSPAMVGLGGFGLLADFDKFLGMPGLLHSLLTLGPICVVVLVVERWWRGEFVYAPVIVALILSHLLLDFLDGGPVPVLYPVVKAGVGLQYPISVAFGAGPLGVAFDGPLFRLRPTVPRPGFNRYGFITGMGVANSLLFATIYASDRWGN